MFLVNENRNHPPGDGHYLDILDGLKQQKRWMPRAGCMSMCSKSRRHSCEHNIHADFCRANATNQYVFCGNGSNQEKSGPGATATILNSRLKPGESLRDPHAVRVLVLLPSPSRQAIQKKLIRDRPRADTGENCGRSRRAG